jgi:plasmid stabilization system protein ParE
MPKYKIVSVLWTDRALQDAISIKKYLQHTFSDKEVENFLSLLSSFEIAASAFPELYPSSSAKRGVKRAILSKVVSVFYRIRKNNIEVLAILDNRRELSKWI